MEERIKKILKDVNSDILGYEGTDLIEDHIINSFDIVSIVVQISDEFQIEIDPELIVWERFKTVDSIVTLISEVMQ